MREIFFVGIDPGLHGGYAIIHQIDDHAVNVKVFSIPIIKTKATKTTKAKNEFNIKEIADNLRYLQGKEAIVCLEKVSAMPGQGTVSMFHFGEGFGIWKGIIGTLGLELRLITPMTWKSHYSDALLKKVEKPAILKMKQAEINRLSASDRKNYKEALNSHKAVMDSAKKTAKDNARNLASSLYLDHRESFLLKKDDGKAEALLMAEYLRRTYSESC